MNHAAEQLQELEALESIFPSELSIECRTYPNICVRVTLDPDQMAGTSGANGTGDDDEDDEEAAAARHCELELTLPSNYPDELPKMTLYGLDDEFDDATVELIQRALTTAAEEQRGMAMIFSIVSVLQEQYAQASERVRDAQAYEADRTRREEEEANARKCIGTPVNVETFIAWHKKFAAEREALKEKKVDKRPTGKAQFLADASLGLISDAVFEGMAEEVAIDESLFDDADDLELEEDEEN